MSRKRRQAGFVLIMALTILTLITAVTLASSRHGWLLNRHLDRLEQRLEERRNTWSQ